jgi:hypothetical protein
VHSDFFKTSNVFPVDGSIYGALRIFMANCGLTNALTDVHSEQVPNAHVMGSKRMTSPWYRMESGPESKTFDILDESILKSDNRAIFIDLDLLLLFGAAPKKLERPQFRNLKLDDPRILDSHLKLLHNQFECHKIYQCVKKISERGKTDDWSLEDEHAYEILDHEITTAMLRAAEKCSI